jgi:hypothetical protein
VTAVAALSLVASRLLVAPPVPDPVDLACRWIGPDRLSIEFATPVASAWSVDAGSGTVAAEESASTRHRIEVRVAPGRTSEEVTLVAGKRRIPVRTGTAPEDLVRKLAQGVRIARLSESSTDAVWLTVRKALRAVDAKVDFQETKATVRSHPELCEPLAGLVRQVRERDLGATFQALRPLVPALMSARETPEDVRSQLAHGLYLLDLVDGLAAHLGCDLPFGVQAALAPALAIRTTTDPAPPARDPAALRPAFPGPGGRALMIFLPSELPPPGVSEMIDTTDGTVFARSTLKNRDSAATFRFEDRVTAGAGGKRIHFLLSCLGTQTYMRLTPPGARWFLPVRLPNGVSHRLDPAYWLTLSLTGDLAARTGDWQGDQSRMFRSDHFRPYYIVDQVLIESLP